MHKFLQQIAEYYLQKGVDLGRYTFVFPNRRSAMFMRKYIKESTDSVMFMPRLVSMKYFISSFSNNVTATEDELLFILYNVYCDVLRRHKKESQIPDFDNFSFWGRILLKDFNDIDEYLVDTGQLFHNIKGLKEISANYLTPGQMEVVEMLWGKDSLRDYSPDRFWNHIIGDDEKAKGELAARFLNLWQILDELYAGFRAALEAQPIPIAYPGMLSRKASNKIKDFGAGDFRSHRYVFVGFDCITTSQNKIFKRLHDLGIADFFWDTAFIDSDSDGKVDVLSPAARHILPLLRNFPMPEDFSLLPLKKEPEIEIVSVASNTGQTKYTNIVLSGLNKVWDDKPETKNAELLDTAIVIANPKLLTPLLYSIPPEVAPINVTMGIPYSVTPFSALLSAIVSMQMRSRVLRGEVSFFYHDIIDVLMHPHIVMMAPAESMEIRKEINKKHRFSIPANELAERFPSLAFIFKPISGRDGEETKTYILEVAKTLRDRISSKDASHSADLYEIKILDACILAIQNVYDMALRHGVKMGQHSFLQMLERVMTTKTMNFAGKPLEGLQIMGMTDTRLIDFKNLVVLSMNEDVFPGKQSKPSLIPVALRHGYLLPTQETEESRNSYLFYRLISRAESVRLVYDSRTGGLHSGEMSRYLSQLLNIGKRKNITRTTIAMSSSVSPQGEICVDKSPDVIADLRKFQPGGPLNLSASALKTYLKCPLMFYLAYVKGLRQGDTAVDYIDAASSGSVLHKVAELLYLPYRGERITVDILSMMQKQDLKHLALEALNSVYYKGHYDHHLENIPGEGKILAQITARFIHIMLEEEKKLAPYTFLEAEAGEGVVRNWTITPDYTLNFKMSVDRIDRLDNGVLRFIDYKTGDDEISTSFDKLFEDSKYFGIFQLLAYCEAYTDLTGETSAIQPVIYRFKDMATNGIQPIKIDKEELVDFHTLDDVPEDVESFRERFNHLIHMIFEEENEYPFTQTPNQDNCLYCHFAQMCHRFPDKK